MDLSTITIQQFKDRFYRDFTYANQNPNQDQPLPADNFDFIQDLDIQIAYNDAMPLLNQALFSCNASVITNAYLLLSAHCLCLNIKNADSGINSKGSFPIASKSAGSVAVSYDVPQAYKDDPILASYVTTGYGLRYLMYVQPYLVGNIIAVCGGAQP